MMIKNMLASAEKLMAKYKISKNMLYLFVAVIAALALLLSDVLASPQKTDTPTAIISSDETYILKMETKIKNMLAIIDGVGAVDVMITLEGSEEQVYAFQSKSQDNVMADKSSDDSGRNETQSQKDEQMIVIRNQDGSETPVLVTRKNPLIKGVAVVCTGGDRAHVQQRVIDAVTTVLNISSKRVYVTKKS